MDPKPFPPIAYVRSTRAWMAAAFALAFTFAGASRAEFLQGARNPGCRAAVAFAEPRLGASVLVIKDGTIVCEAYMGRGAADRQMELASGTKSFVGLMAAAAVQDGLLALDEPVAKTLPEWRTDPIKARVTLRQVISLTSGMRSQVGRPPEYAEAVSYPLTAAPGERFQYGPAPFQLFGEVMKRKLAAAGQPPDPLVYLHRRILDPIGLAEVGWRRTPGGDPLLPQGALLTARQWARFGEFVRGGARLDGRPIVDPATFQDLFVGSAANPAYGLSWWLPKGPASGDPVTASFDLALHPGCAPPDLVAALGAGNQRLFVIPSMQLTIVRQAELNLAPADRQSAAGPPRLRWSDVAFLTALVPPGPRCDWRG